MSYSKSTIQDSYNRRHILLTGATGFLGKVVFAMILEQLPNLDCIYILIRKTKNESAVNRFCQEILSSPIFMQLNKLKQIEFKNSVLSKIKVLEGDITQPNLGLSNDTVDYLYSKIDLIIHIAALVDFTPDIRAGLNVNVNGTLNVAEFTKRCQKAKMIHVSTCYVVGNQSGIFEEKVVPGYSPNGLNFDADLELELVSKKIKQITEGNGTPESIKKSLRMLGCERAAYWGWSNPYCYTKAIAEFLLVARYPGITLTIIRPSIIESAVSFPFPGWNEGINGTVPLIIASKTRYPHLVAKKHSILDIVPVDLVGQAIIVIGADVLNRASSDIYQLASSAINPCYMKDFVQTANKWYRNYFQRSSPFNPRNYVIPLLKTSRCVKPNSFLAPTKLIANLTTINRFLHRLRKIPFLRFNVLKDKITTFIGKLRQMEMIITIYQSFIHDHIPIFCANKINQLVFEENQFSNEINRLNWHKYIFDTHLPGLNRWIYSFLEKRKPPSDSLPVFLNENEKDILLDLSDGGSKL